MAPRGGGKPWAGQTWQGGLHSAFSSWLREERHSVGGAEGGTRGLQLKSGSRLPHDRGEHLRGPARVAPAGDTLGPGMKMGHLTGCSLEGMCGPALESRTSVTEGLVSGTTKGKQHQEPGPKIWGGLYL